MNKKLKIHHITTHLGGGVGRVLTNYLDIASKNSMFEHSISSLDYINQNVKKELKRLEISFSENDAKNYKKLLNSFYLYDIILIHWWNHPLMYEFLVKYSLPPTRIIMWSHISGLHAPSNFTNPLFQYADKFVFTTPISFESEIIQKLEPSLKQKISVIWSTAGLNHIKHIKNESQKNFNVGYLGTVDYSKLHRNFLNMSSKINIPNVQFIVCGGEQHNQIEREAISKNINHKFTFTGTINNIEDYLKVFDVFGYPLSKYHFGTCDQVLAETMACGIVPVVFDNKMEKYIVKHNHTGLIVSNEDEYVEAIQSLANNKTLRNKLSKNAKEYALNTFSLEKMFKEFENLFIETLKTPPSKKSWNGEYYGNSVSGLEIFLESLESTTKDKFKTLLLSENNAETNTVIETLQKKLIQTNYWETSSKGTLNQYIDFFQTSKLKKLKNILLRKNLHES